MEIGRIDGRHRFRKRQALLLGSFLVSSRWIVITNGFRTSPTQHHHCAEQRQRRRRRTDHETSFTGGLKTPTRMCPRLFLYSVENDLEHDFVSHQMEAEPFSDEFLVNGDGDSGASPISLTKVEKRNGATVPQYQNTSTVNRTVDVDEGIIRPLASIARHRLMWRRRNARSAEEGIRREKTSKLSSILSKVGSPATSAPHFAARTIAGLINALAEEVHDLEVEVDVRKDTPLWDKHVDEVRINFSRLCFKPLRMGGLTSPQERNRASEVLHTSNEKRVTYTIGRQLTDLSCADEAFNRIDVDNSGALDRDEIVEALTLAAGQAPNDEPESQNLAFLKRLASELVALYDFNGDGVVDRLEYQSMVEDMAALRETQEEEQRKLDERERAQRQREEQHKNDGFFATVSNFVSGVFGHHFFSGILGRSEEPSSNSAETLRKPENPILSKFRVNGDTALSGFDFLRSADESISTNAQQELISASKTVGSIILSDLKLDIRRLFFGAIPILKHITPGGPLILEPFTATVTGSFSRDDIMNSFLLDAGLRRLVAQALKRRVRSLRDLMDFAVFYGRSWKMSSKSAPLVEVPELTSVEFDKNDKLIITGRVRVQTSQEVPVIENSFKLRTKVGTRRDGRLIRLLEPELALVLECPRSWEENIVKLCNVFGLDDPVRPAPIYSFFPIYSPFKLEDDVGFNLGEDNRIKSIYVKDNALRFELSAVLRPGRFLGNHYLAFTLPIRTFIITLDRVKEGIRAARKTKKAADALRKAEAERKGLLDIEDPAPKLIDDLEVVRLKKVEDRNWSLIPPRRSAPKSFFSRFVDGYWQERDGTDSERVTTAIRDFFGRQGLSSSDV